MPETIQLVCDRCFDTFPGYEYRTLHGNGHYYVGYYRFVDTDGKPTVWIRFARGMEEMICRECMWKDSEFLKEYPHMRNRRILDMIITKGMQ